MPSLRARRQGRLPAHLRALRDYHHARAHALLRAFSAECEAAEGTCEPLDEGAEPAEDYGVWPATGEGLTGQPDDVLVSVFVTALIDEGYGYGLVLLMLDTTRLPFTRADVELVLRVALGREGERDTFFLSSIGHAVDAAEQLAAREELGPLLLLLDEAKHSVERTPESFTSQRTPVRTKLHRLLAAEGELDVSIFEPDDDWGRHMPAKLGPKFAEVERVNDALFHFAEATDAPPSPEWRRATADLVASIPEFGELVFAMLKEVPGANAVVREALLEGGGEPGGINGVMLQHAAPDQWREYEAVHSRSVLTDANSTLVRGAIWSLLELDAPWRLDLLRLLLDAALDHGYRPPHACIYVLGELADREALSLLCEVRARVKQGSFLRYVDETLTLAAERWGVTASELRETLLPDFGLDADGHKTLRVGSASALVEIEDTRRVSVMWRDVATPTFRSPEEFWHSHLAEIRALYDHVDSIRDTLTAERARIENLFVDNRHWSLEEWRERYLCHPLLRPFGCALIWVFTFAGRELAALPLDGKNIVRLDGTPASIPSDSNVRLWHPIEAPPAEVAAWRSFLLERSVTQPLEQTNREVYLLTPEECQARTYSNRFAGQIVNYTRVYSLMNARGWSFEPLGPFPGGGSNWRGFEPHGIRAEFWMQDHGEPWESPETRLLTATTQQVWFTRLGEDAPIALEDLPPIVFSEAMRDIGVFVDEASIAADPDWEDTGIPDPHHPTRGGELGRRGQARRDALVELVPQLRIADRCEIDGAFLVVRGALRTYRIHIGKANVLMEPDDEYLCIGPRETDAHVSDLLLPFEDDPRLTKALSLAFLLAEDERIRDRTIRRQIGR